MIVNTLFLCLRVVFGVFTAFSVVFTITLAREARKIVVITLEMVANTPKTQHVNTRIACLRSSKK